MSGKGNGKGLVFNFGNGLIPGQAEFLRCTSEDVMLSGSFGSGKTRGLCEKALFLSMYYPGNRGLIVRKFYNTLSTSTLWTLLEDEHPVIPPELILEHHKTKHIIKLKTPDPKRPSYIFYGGLDDPKKLGSFVNLGWVGIDEGSETTEEDWSQLAGRIRLNTVPFHQMFTATNPDSTEHYLYKKFYNANGKPRKDKDAYCIESNSLQNPYLPESYRKRLEKLTGIYRDRYVLGKWVAFGGQIYETFSIRQHVCPNFPVPREWPRIMSVDFGYIHPLVVQWWAIVQEKYAFRHKNEYWVFPKGSMILYREIYMTHLLYEDAADMALKFTVENSEEVDYLVADWDAQGRGTFQEKFEPNGIEVKPAMKDVEKGIQETYQMMRVDPGLNPPAPKLFFFVDTLCHEPDQRQIDANKPTCTVEEIPGYRRRGKGINAEKPIKINDDGCDAMRYAVMSHVNRELYEPIIINVTRV